MKRNYTKLLGHPNSIPCRLLGWSKSFAVLLMLLFFSLTSLSTLSAQCSAISNIKFVANNPLDTKVHYGDGSKDSVLTSLEPQDYVCFDTVPFLILLSVNANAACQDYTVELPVSWLCNTTGKDGIGATKIVGYQLNDASDTAVKNLDGDEAIDLFDEDTDGTPLEGKCELTGVFRISGLDPGDVVVIRIDVLLDCKPSTPTGNIQAALGATQDIKIIAASDQACLCENLQGGNQTIPWKVGLPECGISCSITEKMDVSCNGASDGSATVNYEGAFGEVTYAWSTGAHTATVENLSAGTYTVTVTDFLNCSSICEVTIEELNTLECTITKIQDVSCKGGNDGKATVEATGGDGNYTFDWGGADPEALSFGVYKVTVTDGKGCTSTCEVFIKEPLEGLSCTITKVQDVSCKGGNDGKATVSASGGDGNYTFDWGGADPDALVAGTYVVTVTDGKKCTSICAVKINEPAEDLSCEIIKVQDVSCFGGKDGKAIVSATGGSGEYTFNWGDADPDALAAGTYTVTVTDSKECSSTCSVTINEPQKLEVNAGVGGTICEGGSFQLEGSAKGGTGELKYSWLPSGSLSDPNVLNPEIISPLINTEYTLEVTDENGCTASDKVTIIVLQSPKANLTLEFNDICYGETTELSYTVTLPDGTGCDWTLTGPGVDLSSANGDEPSGTIAVGAGLDPGIHPYTLEINCTTFGCAVDPQTIDLLVEKCVDDCTWTPGFWKNHPEEICGLLGGTVIKEKGKRSCEGGDQNIGFILCEDRFSLSASDISCLYDYTSNLRGNKTPEACSDNPGIKAIAEHFAKYPNGVTLLHHILAAQMNLLYNGAKFGEIEISKFICVGELEEIDIANIFNGEIDEDANEVAAIQFCIDAEATASDLSVYIDPLTTYNECNDECGLPSEQDKVDADSGNNESEEENEGGTGQENGQGNGSQNGQGNGQENGKPNSPNENSEKHFQRIQQLKLYPNPVRDDFLNITFKLEAERAIFVRILDMTGNVKIEQELTVKLGDNETQVDISVLPSGLYMLQLSDGMLVTTKRFMRMN